uniref:non-specific serine/threonine protein kinase n=1 Tax=Oryza meridionalis TaxID=40149 RepID=A0A0E0F6K1_9ORYZ
MHVQAFHLLFAVTAVPEKARAVAPLPMPGCAPRERDALLAFKRGIISDGAGLLASWKRDDHDCCRWRGVRCSNLTGRVVKLRLRNNRADDLSFDSSDDAHGGSLFGQISPSLLSLHHLKHLDLTWNQLQGPDGRVPEFLGSFKKLRYLNLSGIPFSSEVPPQLGNLSKLHYLDLSLSDNLYSTDLSWLARLPLLQFLSMESVNISTIGDWPHVVNTIPSLRVLDLSNCSLTSANQSLSRFNFTNLEIDLFFNYFDHPIATCWFWNLTSLKRLDLLDTGMHGEFPDALTRLASLKIFVLGGIRKSSNKISLNTAATNLTNLKILMLIRCFSHGNITEIMDSWLPQCSSSKLKKLNLQGNNLVGVLPNWMGHLTGLKNIGLSDNRLKIVVGSDWIPPFQLKVANLASCHIGPLFPSWFKWQMGISHINISRGPLPLNLGAPRIEYLILRSNNFTGQIPVSLCEFDELYILDLSNNNFEGELPKCFKMEHLSFLLLSKNSLSGKFLPSLQSCTSITFLDLSWNRFSGKLPMWISNLVRPRFLKLSYNKFDGHIPTNITDLSHLYHLNLAANSLSGVIPWQLSNLEAMTKRKSMLRKLPNNYSRGVDRYLSRFKHMVGELSVTTKRQDLKYQGFALLGIVTIDLSSNYLTESLDLSENKLSGEIPSSISKLTYLSTLDLSYNNLIGRIPSGGQLDTLYNHWWRNHLSSVGLFPQ